MKFAKDKIDPQQEIKELIRNANEMDIDVSIPDFRNLNEFFILKNKTIYFGLTDIKGVGSSVFKKIQNLTQDKNVANMTWLDIAHSILLNINSVAAKALISCGSFDYFKKNRTEMLFEHNILSTLTKKELENFATHIPTTSTIRQILETMLVSGKISKNRQSVVQNLITSIIKPPYSLIDKIEWLSDSENALLGAAITCSKLDTYDVSMSNCNCKTFKTSVINTNIILAGEIINVNFVKTKKGKNPGQEMAFVSIEDQVGILDSIIFFPEQLDKYRHHLYDSNILVFCGSKSKTKDGLIVNKCFAPSA